MVAVVAVLVVMVAVVAVAVAAVEVARAEAVACLVPRQRSRVGVRMRHLAG